MFKKKGKIFTLISLVLIFLVLFFPFAGIAQQNNNQSNNDKGITDKIAKYLGNALAWVIGELFTWVLYWFLALEHFFLKYTVDLNFSIPESEFLINAWKIVRDFANLFFAFAMLVIGIATIVGWEEYQAQKMLPKLLLIALLINFSLIFCMAIIDIGNAFAKYFENAISPAQAGSKAYTLGAIENIIKPVKNYSIDDDKREGEIEKINEEIEQEGKKPGFLASLISPIAGALLVVLFLLVLVIVKAALIVLFFARFIVLSFLIILAPIAWIFYFFPFLEEELSIWKRWWSSFLKWTIIGPALLFFVWLAVFSLGKINQEDNSDVVVEKAKEIEERIEGQKATTTKKLLTLSHTDLPNTLLGFLTIGFLLAGLKISVELGGYGSQYFYNLGSRVVNKPKEWSGRVVIKSKEWSLQKVKEKGREISRRVSYWTARKVSERIPPGGPGGPGWRTETVQKVSEKISSEAPGWKTETAQKVSERIPPEGPGWKTKIISKTPLLRIIPRKAIEYSQKERTEFQEKVKTLSTLPVLQLKKLYNLGGGYYQGKFYQREPILGALAEKGGLLPEHFDKKILKRIIKSPLGQGFLSERYFIAKPEFSQAIKEKNLPKVMANFIQNLSYQDAKNIKIDNLVENQEKLASINPDYEKIMKEFYNNLEKSSPKVLEALVSNLKQENLNKFIKSYKESLTKKTPTGKTPFEYLEKVNPNQAKWLKTSPAMALGIDLGQYQPPEKRIIIAKH